MAFAAAGYKLYITGKKLPLKTSISGIEVNSLTEAAIPNGLAVLLFPANPLTKKQKRIPAHPAFVIQWKKPCRETEK